MLSHYWNDYMNDGEYNSSFTEILTGKLLPSLEQLHFAHGYMSSSTYRLEPNENQHVARIYSYLVSHRNRIKSNLQIFIHGLRFDADRAFSACRYNLGLTRFYRYNAKFEVRPCMTVSDAAYLDESGESLLTLLTEQRPGEPQLTIPQFFKFFPNLRVVILDRRSHPNLEIDAQQFLKFLRHCSAMTELELQHTRLGANFYSELIQVPFSAELHSLIINENEEFDQVLDLESLGSKFNRIQKFSSNIATRATMLQLVRTMRTGADFEFYFYSLNQENGYYQIRFSRESECYYLVVTNIDLTTQIETRSCVRSEKFIDYEHLTEGDGHPSPDYTSHWLD